MDGNLDDLLDKIDTALGRPKEPRKPKPLATDDKLDFHARQSGVNPDFVRAVEGQESGGRPRAQSWAGNKGRLQVSQEVVNRFVKRKEFGTLNPYNEDVNLAAGTRYFKWLIDRYNGDEKRALAGYNAGEGNADHKDWYEKSKYWSNDPAVQKGLKPRGETDKTSTRNYIDKIWSNYKGKNQFSDAKDYSGLLNDIDSALKSAQNTTDYTNLLGDINATLNTNTADTFPKPEDIVTDLRTGIAKPKVPVTPTNPVNVAPVPEPRETISKQIDSAVNSNSPRIGVLVTDDAHLRDVAPELGDKFIPVQTNEGTLFVNAEKARSQLNIKSPSELEGYISQNGYASILGKVEDVTGKTGDGLVAVRTTDANGKELTSSVVNDPFNVQKQKELDAAQFPNQPLNQQVTTVDDAIQKRVAENNSTNPFRAPNFNSEETAEEPINFDLPPTAYKSANASDVAPSDANALIPSNTVQPVTPKPKIAPSESDADYKQWLDYKNKFENASLTDSHETRAKFHQDLAANQSFGQAAVQYNENKSVPNVRRTLNQPLSKPRLTEQPITKTTLAPGTPENLQNETVGSVLFSKKYAAKPTAEQIGRDFNESAYGKSAAAALDLYNRLTGENVGALGNTAAIQADIDAYWNPKTGEYSQNTPSPVFSKEKRIVEAYDKNGEQGIKDLLAQKEQTKADVGNSLNAAEQAQTEQSLRDEAAHQLREDKQSPSLLSGTGGLGSYIGDKIGGAIFGEKSKEPTEDEINQRVEQLKNSRIDADTREQAKADAEWLNSNAGKVLNYVNPLFGFLSPKTKNNIAASAIGGAMNSVGSIYRTLAGAARPVSGSLYGLLSRVADKSETLGANTGLRGTKTDAAVSEVFKIGGALPGELSKLYLVSRVPGGIVVGMGLDSALQEAGKGGSLADIQKGGIKGAATGGVFELAPVGGKAVENLFTGNTAKTVAREAATFGFIGGGTAAVETLSGTPPIQAIKVGIVNGAFHLASVGTNLIGKTIRARDAAGNTVNAVVTPENQIKELKGEVENPDIEMVMDADGVYKANGDGLTKNEPITSPSKSKDQQNQTVGSENTMATQNPSPSTALSETMPPRELAAENPKRIERPQPEAIQKAAIDTRAQKVIENLKDKGAVSIEELQKATRYNKTNVEDAVLLLYAAKQIEILPDNSVRFIGSEAAKVEKSLFERAAEIEKPKEQINLSKSPIENEINEKIQSPDISKAAPSVEQDRVSPPDENIPSEKVNPYEALPQQKLQEAKAEKPKARLDFAERPNIAEKLNVFTERGTKASIEPKVVDQSDLLTSLDEGYPPEFQPRDRSRAASKAQISEIAGKLNPEFLGDSPKVSDGRPLVVPVKMPDGATKYAVISGNGRTEGIRQAYKLKNEGAKRYTDFAKSKGATTARQPVYVGVLDPNEVKNLPNFAKEANESATAQMSATERAKSDAGRLSADLMNKFAASDDGSIHGGANRDFVRGFIESVPPSERGALQIPDGGLSQEGVTRVRNAIFARAFGDSENGLAAIQRMSESTDNAVKNITNGLLAKAGQVAALKEAAKSGIRYKEFDVSSDLAAAMEKYASLKDSGTSVDDYIHQGNLFGAETTPFQTRVMQVFDAHKKSAKAIRSIIDNYLSAVEAVGDPNQQNLFGAADKPSVESVFEGAVKAYERNIVAEPKTVGLFDENQGRESESGTRRDDGVDAQTARQTEIENPATVRQSELENRPLYSKPTAKNAEINLKSLYNNDGEFDYESVKNIAGRVGSGELEITRLAPREEQGRIAGGQRNVEASIIAGADARTSRAASQGREQTREEIIKNNRQTEDRLEKYAKHENIWFDYDKFTNKYPDFAKGEEARIFRDENPAFVLKIVDYTYFSPKDSPLKFIDERISLFNYLFPETKYELVGFTRDDNGRFQFILRQPFIVVGKTLTPRKVSAFMKSILGADSEFTSEQFANNEHHVSDLHLENVVQDKNENVFVIDAMTELTPARLGGTREYEEFDIAVADKALIENNSRSARPAYSLPSTLAAKASEIFYSQLEKTITDKMSRSASAEQVRGIINNPQTGIKQEERDWLGINEFLDGKDKVSKDELLHFIGENQVEVQEVEKSNDTKFSQHKLPGGENYKELLLTMPPKEGKLTYKSSHFDEPNILAHIRFDERSDAGGNRILHIAEIQSDWHQAGRQKGYQTGKTWGDVVAERKSEIESLRNKNDSLKAAIAAESNIENAQKLADEFNNNEEEIIEKQYKLNQLEKGVSQHALAEPNTVPDAPFKKSWQELAFKRALRYAVENNFDAVSWDTGATQNDRYALSKSIDAVNWRKVAADGYRVEILRDGRDFVPDLHLPEIMSGEKIAEVLGKDVARSITESENRSGKLSGDNLKMGGGGMTGFYDKILPAFVSKYIKKWGAKVENADIITEGIKPETFALYFPGETPQSEQVHSVAITPVMRESVMRGQPLFQRPDKYQLKTADGLIEDLNRALGNDVTPETVRNGKISSSGVLNEEAFTVIAHAHSLAFGADEPFVFFGTYLSPGNVRRVRASLERMFANASPEGQRAGAGFLQQFDASVDSKFGDAIHITTGKNAPSGLKAAVEEERAHRADYRVGLSHSIGKQVVQSSSAGLRAIGRLRGGAYEGANAATAAMEVVAKLFVENESETGLTKKEKEGLLVDYHNALAKNGKTSEDMEAFADVSDTGRRFAEYARKQEKERELRRNSGSYEPPESARKTTNGSSAQSYGEARRTGLAESDSDFPKQPRNIGTGLLEGIGDADQFIDRSAQPELTALEKREDFTVEQRFKDDPNALALARNEILFARAARPPKTTVGKSLMKIGRGALDVVSAPKSLMSSLDISAPGRQGAILTIANPNIARRAFVAQLKSFSEKHYEKFVRDLDLHPAIEDAENADLYLSTLADQSELGQREESFMSRLVGDEDLFKNRVGEKARRVITWHVRASERAYVTYLDHIRINTFSKLVEVADAYNARQDFDGEEVVDSENNITRREDQIAAIAQFVNYATGRGTLGKFEDAAPILNGLFFSPRFIMSRLQLMNPAFYAKLPGGVRSSVVKQMLVYAAATALMIGLLKLAGGEVEPGDFNNPDFLLKVKFGNFHYDFGAGFAQPIRYIARMVAAGYSRLKGGKTDSYGEIKESALTKQFIRSKLSPAIGSAVNLYSGTNMIGEPSSVSGEALNLISPMIANDVGKAVESDGSLGILKDLPSLIGIGVSIYAPKGSAIKRRMTKEATGLPPTVRRY